MDVDGLITIFSTFIHSFKTYMSAYYVPDTMVTANIYACVYIYVYNYMCR